MSSMFLQEGGLGKGKAVKEKKSSHHHDNFHGLEKAMF